MTNWRCPRCGTPQAETARCWVCGFASTTCSSCRHFRRSVARRVGYCGLDPHRAPLSGDEVRPCWEAIIRSTIPPAVDDDAFPGLPLAPEASPPR